MTPLRGRVLSIRRGLNRQYQNEAIVEVEGVTDRSRACSLIGRKVRWVSPKGRAFIGSVLGPHGDGGAVVVRFRKPLPGQILGSVVEIEGPKASTQT